MDEYLVDYDACGSGLSVALLHRFISRVQDALGLKDGEVEFVSGSGQCDMARLALAWLGTCSRCEAETQVKLDDPFVNPLKRLKGWHTFVAMPEDEIHVEHIKGRCRVKRLSLIG